MIKKPLLPCQQDLPLDKLARNYEDVRRVLNSCPGFDLEREVIDRSDWSGRRPVTVLSVACGVGGDVEELVRTFGSKIDEWSRAKIVGRGIDLNPLPELIPVSIREIDPETGERVEGAPSDLLTQFVCDDLCTLETIEDGSVDVLWCVSGYPYAVDTLAALENGWRVLRESENGKEGGVMVVECPFFLMSSPDISEIFERTPGARQAFAPHSVGDDEGSYAGRIYGQFILARKSPGVRFMGFPFRLVGERPGFKNPLHPWQEHCRVGIYEYWGG